jgi:hypothetical protein
MLSTAVVPLGTLTRCYAQYLNHRASDAIPPLELVSQP